MVKLIAQSAFDGLLPLTIGAVTLEERSMDGALTLAALPGDTLEDALSSCGLTVPAPGEAVQAGGARAVWTGAQQVLLWGAVPVPGSCAMFDAGDGLGAMWVGGAVWRDVLARLVPVDLTEGAAAVTVLGLVPCTVIVGDQGAEVIVPRPMAGTVVEELSRAARSVIARG